MNFAAKIPRLARKVGIDTELCLKLGLFIRNTLGR